MVFGSSFKNSGNEVSYFVSKDFDKNLSKPIFSIPKACWFENPKRNDQSDDLFML
ncbi:MAG: hypothetical protein ACI924_002428 [Flavobacterium sp.]|jgi:hypothetical protein